MSAPSSALPGRGEGHEFRPGFEVIIKTPAWVSRPPRGLPSGKVTLRTSRPVTSGMP